MEVVEKLIAKKQKGKKDPYERGNIVWFNRMMSMFEQTERDAGRTRNHDRAPPGFSFMSSPRAAVFGRGSLCSFSCFPGRHVSGGSRGLANKSSTAH